MATNPESFDVWFQAANTVYTGVPYRVVADWCGHGRLSAVDRVRVSGTKTAWKPIGEHPLLADFLGQTVTEKATSVTTVAMSTNAEPIESDEPIEPSFKWPRSADDDDDDVDMIPLIDISLVLLIYFMMTAVVATMSPVDVPGMKNAAQLSKQQDAITVMIDRQKETPVYGLRIGERAPTREDSNLDSMAAVLARLDAKLAADSRPPEVRVACDKALPRRYVRELSVELDRRKRAGRIAYYGAEVNEITKPTP